VRVASASVVVTALLALAPAACRGPAAGDPQRAADPAGDILITAAQRAQIDVAPVRMEPIETTLRATGRIGFDEARVAHVFSPLSGRVVKIAAELGQPVKKGDVLAVIQSGDVAGATSDLAKADADLIATEHDYTRKKELFAQHATSRTELETSEDNHRRAKAERERARLRSSLLKTGGSVDTVSSTIALRSPIGGDVIARNISPQGEIQGQSSGGAAPELFTVGDVTSVWLNVDVFEIDVAKLKAGEAVRARTVAYPARVFVGSVDRVGSTLDPATRTVRVRCRMPNADRALLPEMFVSAEIVHGVEDVPVVASEAVVRVGDQMLVFIERAGRDGRARFERRRVNTSEVPGHPELLRVLDGVAPGDPVATRGAILLVGLL
jgi:cobalt-zinc-cadmium efflux system membrane fusion protein